MTQDDHRRAARLPADLRRRRRDDGDRLRPARRHAQPARRRSRTRRRRSATTCSATTKADITRYLASQASCVLVDPVCAVPQLVDEGVLDRDDGAADRPRRLGLGRLARRLSALEAGRGRHRPPRARARRHRRQDHDLSALRHAGRERRTTSRSSTRWSPTSPGRTCCWSSSSSPTSSRARAKEDYAAKTAGADRGRLAALPRARRQGAEDPLSRARPEACAAITRLVGRRAVGGAVGGRRPRDLPRPGRDRHGERRLGRHRRALALEGLHLARPRRDAPAAGDHRRPAAARDPGGDRPASRTGRGVPERRWRRDRDRRRHRRHAPARRRGSRPTARSSPEPATASSRDPGEVLDAADRAHRRGRRPRRSPPSASACPGRVDFARRAGAVGRLRRPVEGAAGRARSSERFGRPVTIDNDASMALVAEAAARRRPRRAAPRAAHHRHRHRRRRHGGRPHRPRPRDRRASSGTSRSIRTGRPASAAGAAASRR